MAFLNMYRNVSLPPIAELQSSCIFLAMDLVVGPEFGPKLDLLPSRTLEIGKKFNMLDYAFSYQSPHNSDT